MKDIGKTTFTPQGDLPGSGCFSGGEQAAGPACKAEETAGTWRASVKRGLIVRFQAIGERHEPAGSLTAKGAIISKIVNRNAGRRADVAELDQDRFELI